MSNCSISLWGTVGNIDPPKVVNGLTMEESKPRLCLVARFVNLFTQDKHFKLDTLLGVPRMAKKGMKMTSSDDKCGFHHILVSEESKTYFGFRWGNFFLNFNVIPFGWTLATWVYHTTGMVATSHMRSPKWMYCNT